jgi:hypothetical protein
MFDRAPRGRDGSRRGSIMSFEARGALAPMVFLCVAVIGSSFQADAGTPHGIPRSAPAFTIFVARVIERTLPGARVTIAGRLRLDVQPTNGVAHTTDLHNIYSACRRAPDRCEAEVATFVGDMDYAYTATDTGPSRATLRIVVRPSAYVAAMRVNPKRNRPIAVPLVGDYWIIAVDDRPTTVVMLDENDLTKLDLSAKDALALAMTNTRSALEKSVNETLSKGCTGALLGDGTYVASTVAFPDLWADAARRCHGTLFISIPGADAVLYTDGIKPNTVEALAMYSAKMSAIDERPFSNAVFRWTPSGWVLVSPSR